YLNKTVSSRRFSVKLFRFLKWFSYKPPKSFTISFLFTNSDATLHKELPETSNSSKFQDINIKPIYISPRNPIVLCHGLYGFDVKGPASIPFLQTHYWSGIYEVLKGIGAKVVISRVPSTGSIPNRAFELHNLLKNSMKTCNSITSTKLNMVGHSMGGLDARFLISNILPKVGRDAGYSVDSLTTISTPHHGSPFMDWCREYLGLGKVYDFKNHLLLSSNELKPNNRINERIADLIKHVVNGSKNKISNIQLEDISSNDKRLSDFSSILNAIMLDKGMENINYGSRKKQELNVLSDKRIIEDFLNLQSKNVTSSGWGVSGGSYLSQSVVLLKQLFERIMQLMDTPAYYCLTTEYCNQFFNPSTLALNSVQYYSYGAKIDTSNKFNYYINPLWLPHSIVYNAEGNNDGYVSIKSAKYGQYIETLNCDHFSFTNRPRLINLYKHMYPLVYFFQNLYSQKNPDCIDHHSHYKSDNSFTDTEFNPNEFFLRLATRLYNQGH
ncbi:hypothetical protein BB561_005546, partial [Smittium simulii]